ncbi:sulfotransferase [Gordonia sp. TBRC 11910]|uniref:Trehalose 2-sulfotransferase n=1 Tax=Gordonia asplenii TaxID=2725283 RepID=A0A848L5K3_9ACTN|nr:Stf0 family sulfotransferase [Gordonia asplenii]NMO03923.1 sulfotransferase [Gordonia asplenii]
MSASSRASSPRSYLVCASQRSGSTLLVETLRSSGVAGHPQEFFQYLSQTSLAPQPSDWFVGVDDRSILTLLAPDKPGVESTETADDWRARILREGSTDNGVWGGKLMWNQTPLVLERAAGLTGRTGTDLHSALGDILGDVLYIKVTRQDVVSQAVSFWRAVQTNTWRGRPAAGDDVAQYHQGAIAHLVKVLQEQELGWRTYFADHGIEPVEVAYADLANNTAEVLGRVIDAIGLNIEVPPPALKRQADKRSDEWVDRFRDSAPGQELPV